MKRNHYILEQVAKQNLEPTEALDYLNQINKNDIPAREKTEWAIIGMACRFPKANNLEEFWQNLMNKVDCVGSFPKNRIEDVRYANQKTFEETKGLNCRLGSYFDHIDLFDHSFFSLTPAEARLMDPSQRFFQEVAIEAIENAGLTEKQLQGSKTGVYVGHSINDENYINILNKDDPNVFIGNQPAMLAYRLAYLFDMRGPTMIIDTSCSSSLVAVHQACQAIEQGDCEQAIVCGVNLHLLPLIRDIANLGIEAYDGRCKTFDEKANGTNIAEGVAVIIIKRKDLAERDGDYIHALIKGSAVNSDGKSNGLTAPNPEAQTEVILSAWKKAAINPEKIAFIESHGTGTKLGDPIEINGLTHAFQKFTSKKQFCPLGAVKTNIGHTEAAAGIAGLIKVVLSLQHRQLPPNIHFTNPNPYIDFANSPLFPNVVTKELNGETKQLLAGLSSFGISGTNSHVVLEEYLQRNDTHDAVTRGPELFLFSAKNVDSLKRGLEKHLTFIKKLPNELIRNFAFTLSCGRNHYNHRLAIMASSLKELSNKIEVLLSSQEFADGFSESKGVFYSDIHEKGNWMLSQDFSKLVGTRIAQMIGYYFSDQSVDWKKFFDNSSHIIPLPSYAFNKRRHWPKLEIEHAAEETSRINKLFYSLEWQAEELDSSKIIKADSISKNGTWIYFLRNSRVQELFVDLCEGRGAASIKVYPGITYQQHSPSSYTINPSNPHHYSKLLHNILKIKEEKIAGFIHLWGCQEVSTTMDSYESISGSQDLTTFSCFHLIRASSALMRETEYKFVTVTSYAQKVDGSEEEIDPSRISSLGLNKVISQEFPKIQSLALDIDLDMQHPLTVQKAMDEIFSEPYSNSFVAFRQGKRFVQMLERMQIENLAPAPFQIKENGVYLIAGGAAYLGLETALFLARQNKVNIALIGRRGPEQFSDKQKRVLNEIEEMGSSVLYQYGDITNHQECAKFIEQVHCKFGPVDGIFVAIKNISHQLIEDVSFDYFKNNLLSKLKGVWLLDELTKEDKPDFMATFSSISSVTGGPTGADCCASNLFLDSYTDYRNALGRRTITMNYTLIEADDGSLLSDRMSMIPAISKEEFQESLELFLVKDLAFALVVDFDGRVMNLVLPFMKIGFSKQLIQEFLGQSSDSGLTAIPIKGDQSKSVASKAEISFSDLQLMMTQIWKDVLGYQEITEEANFFDIGGDSISAVKLIHLSKVQLQGEFVVADLYSHPTLLDFCQFAFAKLYPSEQQDPIAKLLEQIDSGLLDPKRL